MACVHGSEELILLKCLTIQKKMVQFDPYQNSNYILHRNRKKSKMCMEP
jgi:hypothetical protein